MGELFFIFFLILHRFREYLLKVEEKQKKTLYLDLKEYVKFSPLVKLL